MMKVRKPQDFGIVSRSRVALCLFRLVVILPLVMFILPGYAAAQSAALQAYQRGAQLERQGRPAEAIRAIQQAVAAAPTNRGMRTHLAWLLLNQDRPQEALPHFERLAAAAGTDKNIAMGLAITYLKLQQPAQAVAMLDRALIFSPDDEKVLKLLGEALLSRRETAERAWQVFSRLAQRFPNNPEWQRRREEAARLTAHYYYEKALAALREGNQPAALQALAASVRFEAANVGYRTHYGWALGEADNWASAIPEFRRVLQLDPDKHDAHLGLAQGLFSTGAYAAAQEAAAAGLARFPDDIGLLTIMAESLAATAATRKEAIPYYEKLLVLQPEDNKTMVRLARLYIEIEDLNAGQRLLEKVVARAPDYSPAHYTLGQINLWADAYGIAADHFRQVVLQQPENQEARKKLAEAETFLKPQIQFQGGFSEDADTFRHAYVFTGTRYYLTPTVRLETGYGYMTYGMGNDPRVGRLLERAAHRHVLPLTLSYRPHRQWALEVGGAWNDYGIWGTTGNARAGVFYQATPHTGLSLSYAYHDMIDYYGPFKGPYGRMLDDFAEFARFRYLLIDPVSLWSSNIFGASSTQAITQGIQIQELSFWGYQNFLSRWTLTLYGSGGILTDGNHRTYGGTTLTCRLWLDPLVKAKYSFFFMDYRQRSAALANLPQGYAQLYWDPNAFKNHSVGLVFEQNWAQRFKLAAEADMLINQTNGAPGFIGLVELDYLLTNNIALRLIGSYLNSNDRDNGIDTSYQARNIFGGVSFRF